MAYCIIINPKEGKRVVTDIYGVEHVGDHRYGDVRIQISNFVDTKKEVFENLKQLRKLLSRDKDFFEVVEVHAVNDKNCHCSWCRENAFVPNIYDENYVFLKM